MNISIPVKIISISAQIHCANAQIALIHKQKKGCQYKFWTEFQSHEPEFDYLKSLEIEEKINKIKWCKRQNNGHFLISTNGANAEQ